MEALGQRISEVLFRTFEMLGVENALMVRSMFVATVITFALYVVHPSHFCRTLALASDADDATYFHW